MRNCLYCGKNIDDKDKRAKFCSKKCKFSFHSKEYYRENRNGIRDRKKEYFRNYYKKHKEKQKAYVKKWYDLHKEHVAEVHYTNQILRKKFLEKHGKICSKCGSTENIEIHHLNYKRHTKDLMILCRDCHRKLHMTPTLQKRDSIPTF